MYVLYGMNAFFKQKNDTEESCEMFEKIGAVFI